MVDADVVTIPAGVFLMGCESGEFGNRNERPAHRVDVDAFAIARLPITRRQYACFLDATDRPPPPHWDDARFAAPEQPAVGTNWFDAVDFCAWMAGRTGAPYRLPTEAEREKAARGGVEGLNYPWGNDLPDRVEGWMDDPRYKGDDFDRPDPVGQDPANGFGLHNMADLIHEWCADWYDADYYAHSPAANPLGPSDGVRRASRGGSWRHQVKVTRCAARSSIPPDRHFTDYGFRLALSV
jgi:sulfatase modifying factor 1